MLKVNENITLSVKDIISIIEHLEYIIISLKNIDDYHESSNKTCKNKEIIDLLCAVEVSRFITENKVTNRLALIRSVLNEKFDLELGEDDMNDIEREFFNLDMKFWMKPGD